MASNSRNKVISGNVGLKLISLALALLLEAYFYSQDNSTEVLVTAVIELRDIPPNRVVIQPLHAEKGINAQVHIRGPRSLVRQIQTERHRIPISYPANAPEIFTVGIDYDQLRFPTGVRTISVSPAKITVETEELVRKEVPIKPEMVGGPLHGYHVDALKVFPETVIIRGPYSEVERIQTVETEPIDVTQITETTRKEVRLKSVGPQTTLTVTIVSVDLQVSPVEGEKSFKAVAIKAIAPQGFAASIEPSKADVVIGGPILEIDSLSSDNIQLVADGSQLGAGKHQVELRGEFPKDMRILKSNPPKVTIQLVSSNE